MGLISSWLGRRFFKLTDGAAWTLHFGGSSAAGKTVTTESAMKLSAWWACVRLISETTATLPLGIFEKLANGEKVARPDHPLSMLLRESPNADQTPVEFWEGQISPVCIIGNSFAEKKMSGGRLIALEPMFFENVNVERTDTGALKYSFTDRGRRVELPEDKVFHIRGFGVGGHLGLSPVAYARETIGGAMAVEESSAKIYGRGLRAAGFLLSPQVLNETQRKDAHEGLVAKAEGSENEGKTVVLEGGWKWIPAGIPPKDAEMILSRKFNVEEICRWFGVPPILVGHAAEGQTMWGSGIEHIMIGWTTLGLRRYLRRVEAAINKRLVAPAERGRIFAEFNIEGLLRGDSQARGEFYSKLVQIGAMTPNQVADKENLPRSTDKNADKRFVNSTMVPIDMAGKTRGDGGGSAPPALPAPAITPETKP